MNLKITTKMTGKLEGIDALNTSPLDNPFCIASTEGVCGKCYSKRAMSGYRSRANPAFMMNGRILSSILIPREEIPRTKAASFRFNAHGELLNRLHFLNLTRIADENWQTRFALWTKRDDLVDTSAVPGNMTLVYSVREIAEGQEFPRETLPVGYDWYFAVTREKEAKLCRGKCIDCLRCYRKPGKGEDRRILAPIHS